MFPHSMEHFESTCLNNMLLWTRKLDVNIVLIIIITVLIISIIVNIIIMLSSAILYYLSRGICPDVVFD